MFGHFDPDYPRNQQVHDSLTALGYRVTEVHSVGPVLRRWPRLVRAARNQSFDALWVAFLGYSDVPIAWAISRWRRVPLIFDAFVLLHDTFVTDRGTVRPRSISAYFMRALEIGACHLADVVVIDTIDHAERVAQRTRLDPARIRVLHVGAADDEACTRVEESSEDSSESVAESVAESELEPASAPPGSIFTVAYCGSYIPLHGTDVIVRAAALLRGESQIRFVLVGDGQTKPATVELARALGCDNVTFVEPCRGPALRDVLCAAQVVLGVFGTSPKAMVVVPNKVVDALALGRPVITADTPAVRRTFEKGQVCAVPPGDAHALADAILELSRDPASRRHLARAGRVAYEQLFSPDARAPEMAAIMRAVTHPRPARATPSGD